MASIEVFPLAINGIAAPLNLLYKLFSNPLNPSNLYYPLDLGSNGIFGHAIQFNIKDYEYNTTNISPGGTGGIFTPVTTKTLSTISLYMPDTLAVNYNHDYTTVSLTETLGLGAFAGSAIADTLATKNGTDVDWGNRANLLMAGKGLATYGAGQINPDLGTLVGNRFKQVPNPQLQLLYKGIGLREFQFEFRFTPISAKEAEDVDKILQTFTYYSVPKLLGPVSHQYLQPPQLFDIKFLFMGGNDLLSAIAGFFGNLGSNILTSQLSAGLFGSPPQPDIGSNTAKIMEIYHPCALTNMSVDYAPNGWGSFDDGNPLEIRLTLQFKETDIVSKDDIANSPRGQFLKGTL